LIASPFQSPGVDERHPNFKIIPLFCHDRFLPVPVKFSSYRVMDTVYAETLIVSKDKSQNFNSCLAVYQSALVTSWLFSIRHSDGFCVACHVTCGLHGFFFCVPSSLRHQISCQMWYETFFCKNLDISEIRAQLFKF
jgi:hypothetical protein